MKAQAPKGGNFEVPTLPTPIGRVAGVSSFLNGGNVVLDRGGGACLVARSFPATTGICAIRKQKKRVSEFCCGNWKFVRKQG